MICSVLCTDMVVRGLVIRCSIFSVVIYRTFSIIFVHCAMSQERLLHNISTKRSQLDSLVKENTPQFPVAGNKVIYLTCYYNRKGTHTMQCVFSGGAGEVVKRFRDEDNELYAHIQPLWTIKSDAPVWTQVTGEVELLEIKTNRLARDELVTRALVRNIMSDAQDLNALRF